MRVCVHPSSKQSSKAPHPRQTREEVAAWWRWRTFLLCTLRNPAAIWTFVRDRVGHMRRQSQPVLQIQLQPLALTPLFGPLSSVGVSQRGPRCKPTLDERSCSLREAERKEGERARGCVSRRTRSRTRGHHGWRLIRDEPGELLIQAFDPAILGSEREASRVGTASE